jgi:hypothetical protein
VRHIHLTIAVLIVAVVASTAGVALGREQRAARVDCGTKALTFLFWPNGHNAIPSVNFPSYPYPHMEVYKPAAGAYPNANVVGLIEFTSTGGTAGGFATYCVKAPARIIDSRPATGKITQAATLRCKFPKVVQLDFHKYTAPIAIGMTVALRSPSHTARLEVQAHMTGGGSTLRFNPKHCKVFPPPH